MTQLYYTCWRAWLSPSLSLGGLLVTSLIGGTQNPNECAAVTENGDEVIPSWVADGRASIPKRSWYEWLPARTYNFGHILSL